MRMQKNEIELRLGDELWDCPEYHVKRSADETFDRGWCLSARERRSWLR